MKKDIKNIEASVRALLQNKAKETNRPFAEVLQYYGMERFLYRFSRSEYVDKFILKGALMFTVWQVPQRRTTLDIDFSSTYDNQIATIEKVIRDVCKVSVAPDGLVFDSQTIKGQKIKEDADYEGVRVKFRGFLERARIPMQIDVGFGDVIYPKPKTINYPAINGPFISNPFKKFPLDNNVHLYYIVHSLVNIIKRGLLCDEIRK